MSFLSMRLQHIVRDFRDQLARPTLRSRRLCYLVLLSLGLLTTAVASGGAQQTPANPPSAQAPSQPATAPVYDGNWWLSLGSSEQSGFVSGYQDCYTSEYHGSAPFSKEVGSYADDLNKYFLADPTRSKQTVSVALDAVRGAATDAPLPAYKAANPPPPDQPVYDGLFWSDADAASKLGFVEGYLDCHAAKLKDADAKFSGPPSEYVERINQAYSIANATNDNGADKPPMKIAEVLHRLKDSEGSPAKPDH